MQMPSGTIMIWGGNDGNIPNGWEILSGTYSGKPIKGHSDNSATTPVVNNGSTHTHATNGVSSSNNFSHTHATISNITLYTSDAGVGQEPNKNTNAANSTHTHTISATFPAYAASHTHSISMTVGTATESSIVPPYRTVLLIRKL